MTPTFHHLEMHQEGTVPSHQHQLAVSKTNFCKLQYATNTQKYPHTTESQIPYVEKLDLDLEPFR